MPNDTPNLARAGQYVSAELPIVAVPRIPRSRTLWWRILLIVAVGAALFLVHRFTFVILDLWLLESLDLQTVFWTNFWMGVPLFIIGAAGVGLGIAAPAMFGDIDPDWRKLIVLVGIIAGMVGGFLMVGTFLDFLLLFSGGSFGETDPVFNTDIGFYVFSLPAIWVMWTAVVLSTLAGLISSLVCAYLVHAKKSGGNDEVGLSGLIAIVSTPFTMLSVGILGVAAAVGVWLSRYNLLWKDNESSVIYSGAEYVDVTGFFSTLNYYYVTVIVLLGVTAVVINTMSNARRSAGAHGGGEWRRQLRTAVMTVAVLVAVDFGFRVLVEVRDLTAVGPNEPVIQLPFIKQHIDATLKGYGLDKVETASFVPYDELDPLPDADALLASASLRNAPLWPGWVSYLEKLVDGPHSERIMLTGGDPMVYGPTLEIFRQQQKLRTYYNLLDIDMVRYNVGGEKRMFVSAVRELPMAPQPWLYNWGARSLLFTHGYGLVAAATSSVNGVGGPIYASSGIPSQSTVPAFQLTNQSVYYGEGGGRFGQREGTMAFTNAQDIAELDFPTDEGRANTIYPPAVNAGIPIDSAWKRLILAWTSGTFLDILFSDLLGSETRVHYYRTPLERVERAAPFLYLDQNPWAVAIDGGIVWMMNGLTYSNWYPYSVTQDFGEKAEERSTYQRPHPEVNYVRDAVKITMDAYTGAVRYYKFADEPILNTWADIYPGLFTPASEMPADVRSHLQYPMQLMHTQFDDIYKRYHMTDALTFFNMEDIWDDADEVMGPILDEGAAITFSMEAYNWMAEMSEVLPGKSGNTQFALSMVFTNEQAMNLRAIPTVYQDGDDYGRIVVMQVPKGIFYPSPGQADAAIDQDPEISEQISWWNRIGAEVIAGHTTTLVIGREVMYVAPIFIRSTQNAVSQMKRVVAVIRGHAADGDTLEEAVKKAIEKARQAQNGARLRSASANGTNDG